MSEYSLSTPVSETDVRKLKNGDVVYITGTIVTARDQAHRRALDLSSRGKQLPVQFEGSVIFHCGPIAVKENGIWRIVAAGPTTSTRMESLQPEFIEKLKSRIIIGKGGMGAETTAAMERHGAVYCAFTGGAALLAAKAIKKVGGVEWLDLGMPEALWILDVENFGPLIVAIDAHGNNLFLETMKRVEENRRNIHRKIGLESG